MDRSRWMYKIDRNSEEYLTRLSEFIRVAEDDRERKGKLRISCPCKDCNHLQFYTDSDKIKGHLISTGFTERYTCWSWHGELLQERDTVDSDHSEDDGDDDSYDSGHDNLDDMLHDLEGDIDDNNHAKFQELFVHAEKPLYDGCKKHTRLSAVLRLFNVKAANGWSDKGFTDLLEAVHELLPEDNELPVSVYKAKKLICPMGLQIKRIHACPNDCVLYTKEKKDLHKCPVCNSSRYKEKTEKEINSDVTKNGPPAKVLWYLPIIPRLKRLFANPKDAKLFRWHAEERKKDGKIRHVADSPQWRNIDNIEIRNVRVGDEVRDIRFGDEIRNIRFGLSSDGINPFGNMSSRHSTWPVLLSVYNLPPWLCMKRKYIMMSLLIQGPKQPGNDIDVYLEPLIDDMRELWGTGVEVYDAHMKENFQLRAMIFCTISDFPAYGNLSGYGTKGYKACPVCEDDTHSRWLPNCKKMVYMGHRRSLRKDHPYRRRKKVFDGNPEPGVLRQPLDGEAVLSRVQEVNNVFGKRKRTTPTNIWKKNLSFLICHTGSICKSDIVLMLCTSRKMCVTV